MSANAGATCETRFRIIGINADATCETRLRILGADVGVGVTYETPFRILGADVGVGVTYETPFRILGAKQAQHDFESLADSVLGSPSLHNATNARVRVD